MLGESMSGMLTSVGVEKDGGRLPEKSGINSSWLVKE